MVLLSIAITDIDLIPPRGGPETLSLLCGPLAGLLGHAFEFPGFLILRLDATRRMKEEE